MVIDATPCPAKYFSLFQRHLEAAFLSRVDQPDRQLMVSRRVDEVVPQHDSADTRMRPEISGGRRPGPLRDLTDASVDETRELAELWAERHHRTRGGRSHHELREQSC